MMRDSIHIRLAQPDDAEAASVLLYSAYIHTQVSYPLPKEILEGWIEHLARYFRLDGNRFSYQNIFVAEHSGEVVGLVLSFGGRDEPQLNAAVGPWLEGEARLDEWYVDALAVFKDWTRHGIGTRLMQVAEQEARQHGYSKVALNVATENQLALDLYTDLGYAIAGQHTLYDHPHMRMVKQLDDKEFGAFTS